MIYMCLVSQVDLKDPHKSEIWYKRVQNTFFHSFFNKAKKMPSGYLKHAFGIKNLMCLNFLLKTNKPFNFFQVSLFLFFFLFFLLTS